MWEANAKTTLSGIIANLRQSKPNCESFVVQVNDLAAEVIRQYLFKPMEPGGPLPMMDQKACEIRPELESLEAALSEKNVAKALHHAEAALRVLENGMTC